jgi:hypothetical protein
MMNNPFGWFPVSNGHGQGGKTQSGINVTRNRETDGSSGKQIQNDGQINKTASDGNIGDVGSPNLIRGCHHKIFNQIGINPMSMPTVRCFDPAAFGFSKKSALAHDA